MDSDNSSDELSSLMETINQCIDRDSDWKDYYNEKMDEICESSENRSSIYTVLLEERLAYDCAVSGNYEDACLHIQKIVDIPTIRGTNTGICNYLPSTSTSSTNQLLPNYSTLPFLKTTNY